MTRLLGDKMSSNNQLIILKNKKKQFEIHHNLCVDNDFMPSKESLLKIKDKLEDAIKFTNKYCRENIVEYGVYVSI